MAERWTNITCRWGQPGLAVERGDLARREGVLEHYQKNLDTGGWLAAPFRAILTGDTIELEMVLDVIDGAPACTSYTVRAIDGVGLENRTTEVARGIKLREAMANALARSTWEQHGDVAYLATSVELIEAVMGSVQRRRVPVTDERLREVADAYRERWTPGGAMEFAASLHCSERQMYRLVKLARQRGFLEEES